MTPSPYDPLAGEYYDPAHKTSRNFDRTTSVALEPLKERVPADGLVLEVGAGRGRCNEFLGIDPKRVVQLDSSEKMLSIDPREPCLLRVVHPAEELPFVDETFAVVTAFLCDPFLGLQFFKEAFRVLRSPGFLIATTPSYQWGARIRHKLRLDIGTTRFLTKEGEVQTPSTLAPRAQLEEMLQVAGFMPAAIEVVSSSTDPISQDITAVATELKVAVGALEILDVMIASR
jgi:SAM-dependent methyltransferase